LQGSVITSNHFAVPGVAGRYAEGRPYVHHVAASEILRRCGHVARAADIGCGTGLSARALLGGADAVVGVDPSIEMLGAAFRHASIHYVVGAAEQLPLASASCDLATIGSAFHWCDRQAMFTELERVVRRGGGVAIYDAELTGLAEAPTLIDWLRGNYWTSLPRCEHNGAFDVRLHVRRPFTIVANTTLRAEVAMTHDELVSFVLSQASSINAVTAGAASTDALEAQLRAAFGEHLHPGTSATARFDLPFALLRKVA
jgi:ubiquinone/menaquinone biosynthesis C-methylase UbiE